MTDDQFQSLLNALSNDLQAMFSDVLPVPVSFMIITMRPDGDAHTLAITSNFNDREMSIQLLRAVLKRVRSIPEGGNA